VVVIRQQQGGQLSEATPRHLTQVTFPGRFWRLAVTNSSLTKVGGGVGGAIGSISSSAVGAVAQTGVGQGGGGGDVGAAVVAAAVNAVVGVGRDVLRSSDGHQGENQDHLHRQNFKINFVELESFGILVKINFFFKFVNFYEEGKLANFMDV
jgi:hypothetical protein